MALIISPNQDINKIAYADVAYADSYFEYDLEAQLWHETSEKQKQMALITATKHIDGLNFQGVKALPDQPLQFPRRREMYLNDHDLMRLKLKLTQNAVPLYPEDVKRATCEQALFLLQNMKSDQTFDRLQGKGIKSYAVGDVSVTFDSTSYNASISQVSPKARVYLNKYIKRYTRLI